MEKADNKHAFLSLVRVGLWAEAESKDLRNQGLKESVDWEKIYQLSEEQSVIGLVLAGIERYKNLNVNLDLNHELLLQRIGEVQMLEQQNLAMNRFIADLIGKLRKAGIYTLLVKGQGIAQCYERPLWRACGDIDLMLSTDNYEMTKMFLTPLASHVEQEETKKKHLGMMIEGFVVELHGTVHVELSDRVNRGIDEAQENCFYKGNVRLWNNNGTTVFLPSPDNDVIFVFTHILEHFFVEGVGLRQVCDWCRLLWTYKDSLNYGLLESRIKRMGLESEWKVFAALAVNTLGMPKEAMPLYDGSKKEEGRWKRKGDLVLNRIMKCGNFGHNNDLSYRTKYTGLKYKMVAFWRRLKDFISLTYIFPIDAPRFFITYLFSKAK